MKYVYRHFIEAEELVAWLNSVADSNHTIAGLWGTPLGVYVVVADWENTLEA